MTESLASLRPLDFYVPPLQDAIAKVDFKTESQPAGVDCQIQAANDLEAVKCWLKNYQQSPHTLLSYHREAKRLLLWCCYEAGKSLGQLKVQDFEAYFDFLRHPPTAWCTDRATLRKGQHSPNWRPLVGGLSASALQMSFRVLQSLMQYLSNSQYVRSNPLHLIKMKEGYSDTLLEQKYSVWARMLEEDEWQAVQTVLARLPEETDKQLHTKLRAQFLFTLLYFLGLRIHEVATHTWKAFQFREGKWWFFVKGKGGKLGHIPVHESLLAFAKCYRLALGKLPFPESTDDSPLLVSYTHQAVQVRQLFNLVKEIGKMAALVAFEAEPLKAAKLKKLSPHWIRHLCASHQDKAGIASTMIRDNLRHGSHQTTQIYLHAEEALRHAAIQKLSLNLTPTSFSVKKPVLKKTHFYITLTEGPLHKGLGFRKLVEALEGEFNQYRFESYQFDKTRQIMEIESALLPIQKISFGYLFEDLKSETVDLLKKSVVLEASIRLFKAEIAVKDL